MLCVLCLSSFSPYSVWILSVIRSLPTIRWFLLVYSIDRKVCRRKLHADWKLNKGIKYIYKSERINAGCFSLHCWSMSWVTYVVRPTIIMLTKNQKFLVCTDFFSYYNHLCIHCFEFRIRYFNQIRMWVFEKGIHKKWSAVQISHCESIHILDWNVLWNRSINVCVTYVTINRLNGICSLLQAIMWVGNEIQLHCYGRMVQI